jgi:hypothetical protein
MQSFREQPGGQAGAQTLDPALKCGMQISKVHFPPAKGGKSAHAVVSKHNKYQPPAGGPLLVQLVLTMGPPGPVFLPTDS